MIRCLPLLALVVLLAGCSSEPSGSLSGTVTIDGQPLKKGTINLEPLDGKSPTTGGPVQDGKYSVSKLQPGKYRIRVNGEPVGTGGRSQEEVMKMPQRELDALTKNPVPPGTAGNDIEVEVKDGSQTHDIKLVAPGK